LVDNQAKILINRFIPMKEGGDGRLSVDIGAVFISNL